MRNSRKFKVDGDCVLFGIGELDVFQYGTLYMEWYEVGGSIEPRLLIYDDAWSEITQFCDLWQELSKFYHKTTIHNLHKRFSGFKENVGQCKILSQKQFIEILKERGFKECDGDK